jgi:hypothetical protein
MDVLGRVIGGFACLQLERLLSVGLEHHRPLQDIDEFIARMEMAARNGTRWNVGDEYHPFLPLDSGDRLAEEFGPRDRRRLVLRPDLADANSTQSNAYQIYTEKQKELAHWLSPSNEGLLISSPPEWLSLYAQQTVPPTAFPLGRRQEAVYAEPALPTSALSSPNCSTAFAKLSVMHRCKPLSVPRGVISRHSVANATRFP